MKSPNAAVLSSTAIVRSYQSGSSLRGTCRPIEFRSNAKHPQGMRGIDYATADRLISLKQTHRISVQLAVAKTA